jgi:hypothetical protein
VTQSRELAENKKWVKMVRQEFKKKVEKSMVPNNYFLERGGRDEEVYREEEAKYVVGKKCLEFLNWGMESLQEWPKVRDWEKFFEDMTKVLQEEQEKKRVFYLTNLTL